MSHLDSRSLDHKLITKLKIVCFFYALLVKIKCTTTLQEILSCFKALADKPPKNIIQLDNAFVLQSGYKIATQKNTN